ncbi:MAG: type IV pilus biogenesis/stability protein PilW [Thalassotalea sp.]
MVNFNKIVLSLLCLNIVSGCVTQQYDGDGSTPVVQNETTNNEIAMTRISLGLGYLKMGNTTQAKLNLEKAKRFSPTLVQVHTAFAHYYDTVAEPELAIQSYEKALSIQSDDADTLNNYGAFLCKQQQYDAAEAQFLKAIAVPSYLLVSQSYQNLSTCQLQAKNFEKAEMYLEKAILHSPSNSRVLLQMARLQYIKGDYKQGQKFLQRYDKATRRFTPDALALAVKIYEKQYNRRAAKDYAGMLVQMFPASFEAKQYILNGLATIEADKLATEYQLLVALKNKSKKRVVVLSPNKSIKRPKVKSVKKLTPSITAANVVKNKAVVDEIIAVEDATEEQSKSIATDKNAPSVKIDKPEVVIAKKEGEVTPTETTEVITPAVDTHITTAINNTQKEQKDAQPTATVATHVMKKGESLFAISQKYNIHMKSLERWNNIDRNNVLHLGQVLYVEDPNKAVKSQGNNNE